MNSSTRKVRIGAAALVLGALISGAVTLTTTATANAAVARPTVSSSLVATPNICRYGCL